MDQETKSLHLELKADGDAEGAFVATFATLNVVDHHGDVTVPGAFEPGKEVLIGGYQHDMMSLPVGKGVVRADEERAWVEGQFWLDTPHGKAAYQTVKNAGGLMEWSYIFRVAQADYGEFDTGKGVVDVRFLKQIEVWSVDPVLKGAGIATRTDSIKSATQTFSEHADELVTAVDAFVKRTAARIEMRAKDGRGLSADDRTRIAALVTGIGELKQRLEEAIAEAPKSNDISPDALFADMQHALLLANG